jgi:N12 class adenine-specific DNA methylase
VLGFKTEPKPKNVKDALIASIFRSNGIDLGWIAEKLNAAGVKPPHKDQWDEDDVRNGILVSRLGFEDPSTGQLEVRYKYLSGNVREKLAIAEAYNTDGKFASNVEELRKAVPMDIPSHLIEFSLGSSWIPIEIYKDYLKDNYDLGNVKLTHIEGSWILDEGYNYRNEKNRSAGVYSEKFRETIYGHQLVAAALNNRPVKVAKQVSEGYEDVKRFEIMQKVGMTKPEIKRSIGSQLLMVFMLPLAFAGLHLAFAFPMIRKMLLLFGLTNIGLFVTTTLISFAVFVAFYWIVYRITSGVYYRIISGKEDLQAG